MNNLHRWEGMQVNDKGNYFIELPNSNRRYYAKYHCDWCGEPIYTDKARLKKHKHFCSYNCRIKYYPLDGERNECNRQAGM